MQQYARSIDRNLTQSIINDLLQSQDAGAQVNTTLPPVISCQGKLNIFHGQENFLSCSVQVRLLYISEKLS